MLQENFLPCLFFVKSKSHSPIVGTLSKMTVKKSGLGLLNPMTSAKGKYLSLQRLITELIQDVMGEGNFSDINHLMALREERFN